MKGFKQVGKAIGLGFKFPTSAGFTSSSGKVQQVGGYSRRVGPRAHMAEGGQAKSPVAAPSVPSRASPGIGGALKDFSRSIGEAMRAPGRRRAAAVDRKVSGYADGGLVGNAAVKRTQPIVESDKEYGGKGPLLPGYAKGGKMGAGPKKNPFAGFKGKNSGKSFSHKPMIGD